MATCSTKEAAAKIRADLKARKGWTQRDVSIRVEYYSMGSSIHATIRNPAVTEAELRPILLQGERIDYDHATGEILSGGNRFVHIHYAKDVSAVLARRHLDALRRAATMVDNRATLGDTSILVSIGEGVELSHAGGFDRQIWVDGMRPMLVYIPPADHPQHERCLSDAAERLAIALDARKAAA